MEAELEPDRVVEGLDLVRDGGASVLAGGEGATEEEVLLERGEEALGDGVGEAVAFEPNEQ